MHLESPANLSNAKPQVKNILKWILALNLIVFAIKIVIGLKAMSLSILGDAVHSGIDSLNNVVALVMIKFAHEPADEEHPYGHSKFETLGALAIVAFLAIASFELIEKSITRLFNPGDFPNIEPITIYLLAITLLINIFVWLYESNAAKKFNSQILKADAAHTFSDILVTISILASVFFIAKGYNWLDPILGLVIAAVIIRSGIHIIQETVPILVDEVWIKEEDARDLIMSVAKVSGYHNFRSRRGHEKNYLEMKVCFETDSLSEAHNLSHEIEHKLAEKFGQADITIHIEPTEFCNIEH